MSAAIRIQGLAKRYRLGARPRENMLREVLVRWMRGAFRMLRGGPHQRRETERDLWALRDVSFDVAPGEVVGIIGRNGAGKSTLLKLLARITDPTEGQVRVDGRLASLLEVGTGFHDELTGRENIYLNGSILGMKRREIDAQMDEIVAFSGVERFLDTPLKRYSTGMRLRLGFAVAAHLEPDVLLVDEVLAVGDAEFQRKCLDTMRDLRSGGRTVLFVSHNMAAVENLCSRAIWIDGGRVREDGPATDVIRSYLATFAATSGGPADLRDVDNRRGNGAVRYTALELLAPDGAAVQLVRCGDPLKIRLHYEARERVEEPHFGVELRTDLGTLVTELSTWGCGHTVVTLGPGPGHLDLELESVDLMPQRYYLSLWIERTGPVHFDVIDRCAVLDVETADRYGSGRGVDARHGIAFLRARWSPGIATRSP